MNSDKKFFSNIGTSYFALGLSALIFQVIIIAIVALYYPSVTGNISALSIISTICNYILPFPLFYYLMKKITSYKLEKNGINAKTFVLYIGITLTLMWIGNIIGLLITALIGGATQNDISNPVQTLINNTSIWFNLIFVSILAPIFEELFFRKFLIDRTIKYGAKASIILSAVIFGLYHGNLNQFFYAFLMGGFFAYVYTKTGKITYTIALHMIVNLLGSVASLIVVNSVKNLQSGVEIIDIIVIGIYLVILLLSLLLGIIGFTKYKEVKFDEPETKLAQPLRTMFINPGMIFFILLFIFEIILQLGIF